MKCMSCGKEMFTSYTNGNDYCFECRTNEPKTGSISNCDIPMPQGIGQQGWICPKCGRGVSPFVDICPCSSDLQITYSSTTDLYQSALETIKTCLECKDSTER